MRFLAGVLIAFILLSGCETVTKGAYVVRGTEDSDIHVDTAGYRIVLKTSPYRYDAGLFDVCVEMYSDQPGWSVEEAVVHFSACDSAWNPIHSPSADSVQLYSSATGIEYNFLPADSILFAQLPDSISRPLFADTSVFDYIQMKYWFPTTEEYGPGFVHLYVSTRLNRNGKVTTLHRIFDLQIRESESLEFITIRGKYFCSKHRYHDPRRTAFSVTRLIS